MSPRRGGGCLGDSLSGRPTEDLRLQQQQRPARRPAASTGGGGLEEPRTRRRPPSLAAAAAARHPRRGRRAPLGEDEGGGGRPLHDQPVGAAGPEPLGPRDGAEEPHGCSSSGHLQSSWEEHGPFGSAGMGRWTDCTDINHLLFKDPRYTLRFLWECLTSHKETDV
ncbi:transmembrane protein 170B isoform X1 [Macaca fascicularis]|uniref:transmembrane protein 170B isoform X1 n=1 Tax=Macaca fascicularis TaxID=9541 RepID=UPI0032B0285B